MEFLKKGIYFVLFCIFFLGCSDPEISDTTLDGELIFDPSIYDPATYLVSKSKPLPKTYELDKPVFIACHGYSASTFEWDEFKDWANGDTSYFISQVLLGGHGRSYEDFKSATWKDWLIPIKTEYEGLITAGYTNINFVGSSTSCALITELISEGYFIGKLSPNNFFYIDPIVIPSNKTLSLVGVVGPMLGYAEVDNNKDEDLYWYHFRPQETLQELNKLIILVRKNLEVGIKLPKESKMKVYKSIKDGSADPVSAVLLYKGITTSGNQNIEVEMVNSELHVFTRLALRENLSNLDIANQSKCFTELISKSK